MDDIQTAPPVIVEQSPKHWPLMVVGVLIVIALAGGYYFYYFYYTMYAGPAAQTAKFNIAYTTALQPHHAGDHDRALQEFETAFRYAPSVDAAAQTELKMAANYFIRNQGNDREKAYGIYKRIAADTDVSPLFRSLALNDMAFTAAISNDDRSLTMYVFNDAPYAQFLQDSKGDIHVAVRKLYEWSDSLYPTAFAKTQIGFMYAGPLLNGSVAEGTTKEETAQLIQKYVRDGEPLIGEVRYEQSKLASLYLARATALSVSARVLGNIEFDEIETAFQKAITTARNDSENIYSQATRQMAQLTYAIAIYSRFGDERKSDAQQLLTIFASVDPVKHKPVVEYLRDKQALPETDFGRQQIIALAKISLELKDFLERLGWSI